MAAYFVLQSQDSKQNQDVIWKKSTQGSNPAVGIDAWDTVDSQACDMGGDEWYTPVDRSNSKMSGRQYRTKAAKDRIIE
ncbi:hypothetical protein HS088_TW04G00821 [Tripterygium wilfordii]|uniref:Uncharacterized protein n=1 Tax=Tripterygium wilfordii TaxID=458696 RepID=A0A7J7DRB6_TRIWF|nr:hypothetical protein HS088_TW04G00821 [Tripterygium wilfordii]